MVPCHAEASPVVDRFLGCLGSKKFNRNALEAPVKILMLSRDFQMVQEPSTFFNGYEGIYLRRSVLPLFYAHPMTHLHGQTLLDIAVSHVSRSKRGFAVGESQSIVQKLHLKLLEPILPIILVGLNRRSCCKLWLPINWLQDLYFSRAEKGPPLFLDYTYTDLQSPIIASICPTRASIDYVSHRLSKKSMGLFPTFPLRDFDFYEIYMERITNRMQEFYVGFHYE